jgi:hypothetical protein
MICHTYTQHQLDLSSTVVRRREREREREQNCPNVALASAMQLTAVSHHNVRKS